MTKLLPSAAFAAGLAAIAWIAAGLWPAHPLALAMTALIAAAYVAGAAELHRFRTATAGLQRALAEVPQPLAALDDWLARVPAALRGVVRRRIEGARTALPGPAMAPYLSGLLVLLGMLGTFLGMVVTLNGTGLALQNAADLATMRDALAAPVRGLGLAFGTSVAGVAGSAMLGLMTALARRERLAAAQQLDTAAETTLRAFGPAQRRDDALAAQRRQAELVPLLTERLGTLVDTLARHAAQTHDTLARQGERLHETLVEQGAKTQAAVALQGAATQATLAEQSERAQASLALHGEKTSASLAQQAEQAYTSLAQQGARWQAELQAGQATFHERAEAAYRTLAESVGRTLEASLHDAAQAAVGTVQPVVEATMAGLARETGALHARLGDALQQRVDTLAGRVDTATQAVATAWTAALAAEAAQREAAATRLDTTLAGFARTLDERSSALLDSLGTRQAALVDGVAGRHAALVDELAARHGAQAEQLAAHGQAQHAALADAARRLADDGAVLQANLAEHGGRQLADAAARLDASVARLAEGWQQALAQHAELGARLAEGSRDALAAAGTVFERQSAALLQATRDAQAAAAADGAARDAERLAAWSARLDAAADAARRTAQQAADESQARQQAWLDALRHTADTLGAQAEAQATRTVAEVARVLDAAAEAPRAAADVIVQLRDQVVAGAARDRALLEERGRMLETLNTLLDAVREASTAQHAAIESLVASSAGVLAEAAQRFGAQVDAQAGRLGDAAAHAAAGAVELASLGDAFGSAVQRFGETGEQLGAQLQRVEAALGQSLARSDEQLAYYVAQAREVIDLSVLAQQRVVEELQRLAAGRRAEAAEAAA